MSYQIMYSGSFMEIKRCSEDGDTFADCKLQLKDEINEEISRLQEQLKDLKTMKASDV